MKVKDLERTANIAWSPKEYSPILLAAGTAAQQLDASFNTNAALEIYSLNLSEPGLDLKQQCSFPSEQRFHKIIWGARGENKPAGTIIGGCDSGVIKIYDTSKLLNHENGLIMQQKKHTGPVHALDFNLFQENLFATGASESEIFIWDMNNLQTPMTPGSKSQPLEDVLSLSWNKQVQHILASTFASKCVIWDLRKNEPIIKLTDTVSRVRWKVVDWHPEVATQLCLASEEDHSPVIQIWDLRFATSPLKTLENHQRGVLSLAWCSNDPDLLVSCGKDNRILCWNPSSNQTNGEVLSEIAKTNQWSFDVVWCPRNPAIIACPSFDGHISVYSLMGGKTQQFQTSDKIADSFPGMDGYAQAPMIHPQNLGPTSVDLAKPPKWLKRPVGASFSFGGKLITFENEQSAPPSAQLNGNVAQKTRKVCINQVLTEPEIAKKATELEQALEQGNFIEYCRNKAENTDDQHKKYIWHFLRANFEENPRVEFLDLLGYKIEDVNGKLREIVGPIGADKSANELSEDFAKMNRIEDFDQIVNAQKKTVKPFKILTGNDTEGLITQALLLGNVEAAVELCLKAKRFADAIIIAMTGGSELLVRTQRKYLEQSEGYVSSLISALVSEDWGLIINNCEISSWKEALAATLTHASDEDLPILCEQLGKRLEHESGDDKKILENAQLCYVCSGSFEKLVDSWSGGDAVNSTENLQELVELVTFLQRAIERQGRRVQVSGSLAKLLSKYAMILASQGNLNSALSYLGSSTEEQIAALRDRLHVNLGMKPSVGNVRQQSRHSVGRQSFTNYPSYGGAQNPPQSTTPIFATPPVAPRTFSPAPAEPAPNSGFHARKYVLDPSVTNPVYNPPNSFKRNPNPVGGYPGSFNNFNTTPLAATPVPPMMGANPGAPPVPFMPAAPLPPPPTSGHVHPAQEVMEARMNNQPPPGWNDPPVLHKSLKAQAKMDAQQQQVPVEPITHPLYGSAPIQQPLPPMGNNGFSNETVNPFVSQYQPHDPPMFQPPPTAAGYGAPPPSTFNTGTFNQNAITPSVGQTQVTAPPVQRVEKIPTPKPPIPEQHMHMKTVFDELKNQCTCSANNPQLKRKLDDVGKKLEVLYDMLRENQLSPNTLSILHQIVQMVQNGNYQGGLNLHTQLVSGPDFGQIAGFMPGLKVLLQCAQQLQVYLR